jgi:antitoxin VapB
MDRAKVFPNGRSQAVRLPKAYQFAEEEVCITRVGDLVMLFPRSSGWEILANSLDHFTEDFMRDRDQDKAPETRKTF